MSNKKTLDDYREIGTDRGITWIGESLPAGAHVSTTWKCAQDHVWSAPYSRIKFGNGCPHCLKKTAKTEADYHKVAAEHGIFWIGESLPASTVTPTTWKCDYGHRWDAIYHNISHGTGCPRCPIKTDKTRVDYHTLAASRGFTWMGGFLPTKVRIPTTWECSLEHTWEASFNGLQQGNGCPLCVAASRLGVYNAPRTKEDYRSLAARRGFTWVSRSLPANTNAPTTWRCSSLHTWRAAYSNILRSGCPHCSRRAPKTKADYLKIGVDRNIFWTGKLLPLNNRTSTTWKCEHDHNWSASYNTIQQEHGCPRCARVRGALKRKAARQG